MPHLAAVDDADVEKGNQLYFNEQHDQPCCSRCCNEFFQHPFSLLETNGRVIDVQKTFAAKPAWIVIPLKLCILAVTMDVLVRGLLEYNGSYSFYLAYYEQWTLLFCLLYFYSSTINSLFCLNNAQPLAQWNRAPFLVCFTWGIFPLALIASTLNFFMYWSLIYWDLGSIEAVYEQAREQVKDAADTLLDDPLNFVKDQFEGSDEEDSENFVERLTYFTLMKNFGILMLLIFDGQVLNRIPLRWSHLTIAEVGLACYIAWTMIHDATDIGNPDNSKGDAIYDFMDWKNKEDLQFLLLSCCFTMAVIIPAIWFTFYVLSWPCRRYVPIDEDGEIKDRGLVTGEDSAYPVEMPSDIVVPLTAGESLGVKFTSGSPPGISKINEGSQLADYGVVVGMVVDTLTLGDGTVFYELETKELVKHLKANKDMDGKILTLIDPSRRDITLRPLDNEPTGYNPNLDPDGSLTIALPAGSVGLVFNKEVPPMITRIKDTSPLLESGIQVGMCVDTLTIAEIDTTYYQLDVKEFTTHLKQYKDSEGGRIVRFIQEGTPVTLPPEEPEEPEIIFGGMPNEIEFVLPRGPMRAMVDGTPPQITKMAEDSPLHDAGVVEGMVVDTLCLEDGTVLYEMETSEFKRALKENSDSDGRIVKFINPDTMTLTPAPYGGGAYQELGGIPEDNEEEVKQTLLNMGFEEEKILETIQYFKSRGEPLDADACMTRIISE